jgi:hypothetical protein
MLLLIGLVLTGWVMVVFCVVALFRVAARGDEVFSVDRRAERTETGDARGSGSVSTTTRPALARSAHRALAAGEKVAR